MWLNNWHLLLPEIYLAFIITFLLGYGLFFVKIKLTNEQTNELNNNINNNNQNIINVENKEKIFSNILETNSNVSKYNLLNKFIKLCIISLIWTFILIFYNTSGSISDLFIMNDLNNFIKIILLISTTIILILSFNFLPLYKISDFEFPILILLSLLGFLLLISTVDLLGMYLSIETISLSLYILAAIKKSDSLSTEAGLKYFILGALSSGLLLFGCALIYFSTGLTNFDSLYNLLLLGHFDNALLIGAIFLIISLLFKLAAAPFHMWAPDVYEGSPTIVTIYFAIVPKIAIITLLYNLLYGPFISIFLPHLQFLLLISGLLSIFIGTFGAIYQNRVIRLIAFSSISHVGFILLGLASGSLFSIFSCYIYILVYIIMSFNIFTFVLSVFPSKKYFADLLSYYKYNPVLAFTFAFSLLSNAGIPPLAGFFSKFYILLSLISTHFYLIAAFAIILSVIGSYYYIRIIQWMFFNKSSLWNFFFLISSPSLPQIKLNQAIILGSTTYFILTFLFYPKPLLYLSFDFFIQSL